MVIMANKFSQLVIDYVVEYYPFTRTSEMALVLGLTEVQVYRLATRLNVRKSKQYLAETLGAQISQAGAKTRFTKGQRPWNVKQ